MIMKNKYKDLSVNTIVLTISSLGSKFISFFMVPLYTNVLSTEEYGIVDLMTITAQLLIPVLTLNIQDAVLRFSIDDEHNRDDVAVISCRMILFSTAFLALVLYIVDLYGICSYNSYYLLFLLVTYMMGTINNSLNMYLRAIHRIRVIGICGIISSFVACGTNVIFLLFFKLGVTGYMIAYISGTLVANVGMFVGGKVWKSLNKGKWNSITAKSMLQYGFPLVANSVAWWINNASDRYILTFFCGTSLNGIYSIAYKIPSILSMLQGTFYNAWSVSAIKEFNKDDEDGFIGKVFTYYINVSVIMCSVIMLVNYNLAKIIYSNEFLEAWKYVPVLLLGTVFNGMGLFVGCIFTAVKRTKDISITTIIGAVINTILNFVLIPFIGAMGAAIATMIGYGSVFIVRLCIAKNIVKMKVKWISIISCMFILFIQTILASIIENIIYQLPLTFMIVLINYKMISAVGKFIKNKFDNVDTNRKNKN